MSSVSEAINGIGVVKLELSGIEVLLSQPGTRDIIKQKYIKILKIINTLANKEGYQLVLSSLTPKEMKDMDIV